MGEKSIKIGYSLSLSGILAPNGKTVFLAHKLWEEDINNKGGLLGRPVRLVCMDDQTNPNLVPEIYRKLLREAKVDLVIGGYGDNSIKPAMPLVIENKRFFPIWSVCPIKEHLPSFNSSEHHLTSQTSRVEASSYLSEVVAS